MLTLSFLFFYRTNSEESISTLKFADRAKQVMVQAVVNESRPVDYAVVKKLQTEIEILKVLLRRVVGIGSKDMLFRMLNSGGSDGLPEHERLYLQKALEDCQGSFSQYPDGANGMPSPNKQRSSKPPEYNHEDAENYDVPSGNTANASKSEQGTTLEYVISLEKALNKEQVHAQHLTKKNETLIKELEELKMTNMQLIYAKDRGGGSTVVTAPSAAVAGVGVEVLGQMKHMMQNVQTVLKQSEDMLAQTDNIQKIVKKFFKFQLEEEDMKTQLSKIFDGLKTYKQQEMMLKLQEMWKSLETQMPMVASQQTNGGSDVLEGEYDDHDDVHSEQRSDHNASQSQYNQPSHHSQHTPKHRSNSHNYSKETTPSADQMNYNSSNAALQVKRNPKTHTRSLPQLQHVEDSAQTDSHKRQLHSHNIHQDSSSPNGDIYAISSSSSSQQVKKSIRQPRPSHNLAQPSPSGPAPI
ncbi:hypothetical protein EON65_28335, partial [archaeon]